MKAKPFKWEDGAYKPCEVSETTHIQLHLPGPLSNRLIPVILRGSRDDHASVVWSWNGDTEKPTLKPSIRTKSSRFTKEGEKQYEDWAARGYPKLSENHTFDSEDVICHTWINDGFVIFLDDCSHELKGQTLELLEVE